MALLVAFGLAAAVLHLVYWSMIRPVIHDRISYQLSELRDQLVDAHLTSKEGVNTQLFHEMFQSFRGFGTSVAGLGMLPVMVAVARNRDYAAEANRREQMLAESPSWLVNIETTRGRLLLIGAVSNSPFLFMFAAPLILAAASKNALLRIKAAILVVNDANRRGRGPTASGGGMGLAHA